MSGSSSNPTGERVSVPLVPETASAAALASGRRTDDTPPATIGTVLRAPRFAFLVIGQTVSQLGDKLHHMALIALVGAAAAASAGGLELAKLSVVFTAPVILFGPLAGALVDRWDKRVTMIVCDALRALLVLSIPFLYARTGALWPVYAVAFLAFMLGVFFNAAKMALIPDLVERAHLFSANAALSFIGRFATVVGIVGGGVFIGLPFWRRFGWSDYAAGFYLDAGSYAVSVAMLLAIVFASTRNGFPPPTVSVPDTGPEVKRTLRTLVGDVSRTLRAVRHDHTLRFVFGSLVALGLFASTVYVVMTYSVQTVMGLGTKGVGYLGGLLGAGMIVGSLVVGTIGSRWDKRRTILIGNALIGALMIVGGVFYAFAVFVPVAFFGGALLAPVMVSQDTLLHEDAPPTARALIFSTKDLILAGVFMLSALTVGGAILLMGRLGVASPYQIALAGVGTIILISGITGALALPPPFRHDREP
jgi:Na+/melibiose symporter-like transporter